MWVTHPNPLQPRDHPFSPPRPLFPFSSQPPQPSQWRPAGSKRPPASAALTGSVPQAGMFSTLMPTAQLSKPPSSSGQASIQTRTSRSQPVSRFIKQTALDKARQRGECSVPAQPDARAVDSTRAFPGGVSAVGRPGDPARPTTPTPAFADKMPRSVCGQTGWPSTKAPEAQSVAGAEDLPIRPEGSGQPTGMHGACMGRTWGVQGAHMGHAWGVHGAYTKRQPPARGEGRLLQPN